MGEASRGPRMKNWKPVGGVGVVRLGYTLAAANSSSGFEVPPALLGEWVEATAVSVTWKQSWEDRQPLTHLPIPKEPLLKAPTCVSMEIRCWTQTQALGFSFPRMCGYCLDRVETQ